MLRRGTWFGETFAHAPVLVRRTLRFTTDFISISRYAITHDRFVVHSKLGNRTFGLRLKLQLLTSRFI